MIVNGHSIFLAPSLVVVLCSTLTYAITCYHCTSLADGKCDDPFNVEEQGRQDNCSVCWKLKGESPYYQKILIERGCDETGEMPNSGCHDHTQDGISGTQCFCKKDLCNGGTGTIAAGAQWLPVTSLIFAATVRVVMSR